MAWPMALLGSTMAHGGQASAEAHKGESTGNSLTKNGASGWLCRRPALPSAVGSIGIGEHRADSRRAVAPAERVESRALGASKRRKPREWPRSGVQPQKIAALLGGTILFFSEIHGYSWEWNDF